MRPDALAARERCLRSYRLDNQPFNTHWVVDTIFVP